ncbi:hypothetical protein PAPYR_5257 [Paratrimastix pyriformis]|uniref:PA14 domain-containing protein n=1 Tax=Paratrimastix pyriformis TaxID=342808 RepID=A0ABQ8UIB6_9EUKA|nr:hypothetical protein PAPYR_5257 [Paratrimastix pyriformis]
MAVTLPTGSAAAVQGLHGSCYGDAVFTHCDDNNYYLQSFDISMGEYSSIDVSGYFKPSVDGTYTFRIENPHFGQLTVDGISCGSVTADEWPCSPTPTSHSISMPMVRKQSYPIHLREQAGCGGGNHKVFVCGARHCACLRPVVLDGKEAIFPTFISFFLGPVFWVAWRQVTPPGGPETIIPTAQATTTPITDGDLVDPGHSTFAAPAGSLVAGSTLSVDVTIFYDSSPLSSASSEVVITPAAVSGARCVPAMPTGTWTAGSAVEWTIQARDPYDNPIFCSSDTWAARFAARLTGTGSVTAAISCDVNGRVAASATPTAAGSYGAAVTLDGAPIGGSPVAGGVTVTAGALAASRTTATWPTATTTAGNPVAVLIQGFDIYGNTVTCPAGSQAGLLSMTMTSPADTLSASGAACSSGQFSLAGTPLLAGSYRTDVALAGVPIKDSGTASFDVQAASFDASRCVVSWPAANVSMAGVPVVVTIAGRDPFDNAVGCEASWAGSFMGAMTPSGDGADTLAATAGCSEDAALLVATFVPTIAQTYAIAVEVASVALPTSPHTGFRVVPVGVRAHIHFDLSAPFHCRHGRAAFQVTVQGRDAYGNPIACTDPAAGGTFGLQWDGAATATNVSWSCAENASRFVAACAAPTVAGNHTLAVVLAIHDDDEAPLGSSNVTVAPGALAADMTTAVWPTGNFTAGSPVHVTIRGADAYGNPVGCTPGTAAQVGVGLTPIGMAGVGYATTGAACNGPDFVASARPLLAGTYTANATYAGAAIGNSSSSTSSSFLVVAAGLGSASSLVSWPAANVSRAGVPVVVTIAGRDSFGNAVGCEASWADSLTGTMAPTDGATATLAGTAGCSEDATLLVATFEPTIAQTYAITLELAGAALPTSPHTGFRVVPAGPDAAQSAFAVSSPSSPPFASTAGLGLQVTVTARDPYGNPVDCTAPTAGSTFGLLWDLADAATSVDGGVLWACAPASSPLAFVATFTPTVAGNHTVAATLGGTRVGNSSAAPVAVSVRPGALAASTTIAVWPTGNHTAGSPVNVTIRGADAYGNPVACTSVTAASFEVTVAMETGTTAAPGGTAWNTTCMMGCEGEDFVATARPWLAGAYDTWVALAASGEPIANSGATSFRVVAGSAWFATSSVAWLSWAEGGGMLPLGAPAALALAARDPYGNPAACTEATAAGPFAVLDDNDGLPLWGGLLAWSCGSAPGGQQAAPVSTPLLFVGSFTVPPSARVGPHNLTVLCAGAAIGGGATGLAITIVVTARDAAGTAIPCTSATANTSFALLLDGAEAALEWGCTVGSPALFVATCRNCTAAPGMHQVAVVDVAQGGAAPLSGGGPTNFTTAPGLAATIQSDRVFIARFFRILFAAPVVCPEQSTFTGPPDGTCVAGSACTIAIAARDCTGAAVPCTDPPTSGWATAFGLQLDGAAVAVVRWSCSMDSPPLFVAAFNETDAGPHTVAATLGRDGTLLGDSGPTTVIVTPGRATATGAMTPVALSGDGHLLSGGTASFSLAPHDSYGNPIGCTEAEAAAVGTTGGSNFTVLIDGTPLPPDGGLTWSCSPDEPPRFVGTFGGGLASGTHTLAVLCDGAPLGGGQLVNFTVTGPLAPSQSSLSVSSTALPSGSVLVATVTARDASGAVIPCTDATRNATFGLLLDGDAPPDAVWACSDGRPALFLGSFTVSGAPDTNHTVAVVARGGGADIPLGNGSVTVTTTGGLSGCGGSKHLRGPRNRLRRDALYRSRDGRDAAGDVVPCTGPTAAGTFRLLWDGEAAAVPGGRPTWACDPTAPALFTASFIPTQAGTHALAVTYAGQPVLFHSGGSATAQITVTAARAAASQCEFSVPATCNQPPSSSWAPVTFMARDAYGNPVACTEATEGTTFVLRVDGTPASNATTAWACADDGRFVATASAHWALGAHVLTATLDGVALSGRSVCMQLPGSPAASTSSFFTQPSGRVTAGQPVRVHITARDPAGNAVGCSAALTSATFVLLWDGAPMEPQPNLTCAASASAIGLAGAFIPTAAGPHVLSAGMRAIPSGAAAGGLSLLAGNVSLAVVAPACANTSRLVAVAPAVVRPGQNLTVVLEARDAWGVPIPCPYADPAPPFVLLWNGSAPAGVEWGCVATNGTAFSLYTARFATPPAGSNATCCDIEVRGRDEGGAAVVAVVTVTTDTTEPTLADLRLTSSNPFGPSWARPGDTITGTFTPSEPLRAATVVIAGRALPASPAALSGAGQRWAAGRVVDQADCAAGDGAALGFAVSQATDLAGNGLAEPVVATGGAGGVLLDCTAPRLTRVAFVSSNANPRVAQPGDWLRVAFTASEPLPLSRLRISIAAHEMANITISGGGSSSSSSNTIADVMMAVGTAFEAAYQLAAADPVGPVGFTVSELADRAGNPLAAPVSNVTAEGQEDGTSLIYFATPETTRYCTGDSDCQAGGDTSARCVATTNTTSAVIWECRCTGPEFGLGEAAAATAGGTPGRTCVRAAPTTTAGSWAGYLGGALGGLLAVGLAWLVLALVLVRRKRQDEKASDPANEGGPADTPKHDADIDAAIDARADADARVDAGAAPPSCWAKPPPTSSFICGSSTSMPPPLIATDSNNNDSTDNTDSEPSLPSASSGPLRPGALPHRRPASPVMPPPNMEEARPPLVPPAGEEAGTTHAPRVPSPCRPSGPQFADVLLSPADPTSATVPHVPPARPARPRPSRVPHRQPQSMPVAAVAAFSGLPQQQQQQQQQPTQSLLPPPAYWRPTMMTPINITGGASTMLMRDLILGPPPGPDAAARPPAMMTDPGEGVRHQTLGPDAVRRPEVVTDPDGSLVDRRTGEAVASPPESESAVVPAVRPLGGGSGSLPMRLPARPRPPMYRPTQAVNQ